MEELQDAVASTKFRQKLKLDEIHAAITTDNVENVHLHFPSFLSALETPELKREFFYRMCKMRKKKRTEMNIWSAVVSSCIIDDPKIVDKDLFVKMTDKESMPYIETLNAAITILKHENCLGLDQRGEEKLTCLQHRCTRAICNELWKKRSSQLWRLIYATPEDVLKNLQELKPAVLRTIDDNAPSLARPTKKVCTRAVLVLKE